MSYWLGWWGIRISFSKSTAFTHSASAYNPGALYQYLVAMVVIQHVIYRPLDCFHFTGKQELLILVFIFSFYCSCMLFTSVLLWRKRQETRDIMPAHLHSRTILSNYCVFLLLYKQEGQRILDIIDVVSVIKYKYEHCMLSS